MEKPKYSVHLFAGGGGGILADDPAEWPTPLMQRITTRKTHRVHRIETLGNGQVPLCAAVAFIYGRAILRVALRLAA